MKVMRNLSLIHCSKNIKKNNNIDFHKEYKNLKFDKKYKIEAKRL